MRRDEAKGKTGEEKRREGRRDLFFRTLLNNGAPQRISEKSTPSGHKKFGPTAIETMMVRKHALGPFFAARAPVSSLMEIFSGLVDILLG